MRLTKRIVGLLAATALYLATPAVGEPGVDLRLTSGGRPVGAPRGLVRLNAHLFDKLLDQRHAESSSFRLERIAGATVYNLRAQLGAYTTDGGQNPFKGDKANPFNVLIWQRVVDEFAAAVASNCGVAADHFLLRFDNLPAYKVDARMAEPLLALCDGGGPDEPRRLALKKVWETLVGYGLAAERDVFVDYFMAAEQRALRGDEALAAVVWSVLMHPYFYLER